MSESTLGDESRTERHAPLPLEDLEPMASPPHLTTEERQLAAASLEGWQRDLLPTMRRMLIGLAAFFILATLLQLGFLAWQALQSPELPPVSTHGTAALSPENRALQQLEANVVARRYHHATVLLLSRMWLVYLSFLTGMILCFVGSAFVLGKLQEQQSSLTMGSGARSMGLRSSSPGLLLAVVGAALIVAGVVPRGELGVADTSVYISPKFTAPEPTVTESPTVLPNGSDTLRPNPESGSPPSEDETSGMSRGKSKKETRSS